VELLVEYYPEADTTVGDDAVLVAAVQKEHFNLANRALHVHFPSVYEL
jgi:hypothetical protein